MTHAKIFPTATPMKVAIEYPKMPVTIAGVTALFHPFALAIAAAVAGPPTFAFDAINTAHSGSFSTLCPTKSVKMSCVASRITMNMSMEPPASALNTVRKSAVAPSVAKNNNMSAPLMDSAPEKRKTLHKFDGVDFIEREIAPIVSANTGVMKHAVPSAKLGCPAKVASAEDA